MKLIRLILRLTGLDIVSVLTRKFKKIGLMEPNDLTALYYTISSFNVADSETDLLLIISTTKQAIIARMIDLIRREEEKIKANKHYFTGEVKSQTMQAADRNINGPIESKIRILRTMFYESTRDGSFYEV